MNRTVETAIPHSHGLEPWGEVGHVDYINGERARPCPEYVPTRFELEKLARFWFTIDRDNREFFEATGQSGSTEWREAIYADRRLREIAGILGDAKVERLTSGAERALDDGASVIGALRHLRWVLANTTTRTAQRVWLALIAAASRMLPRVS